MGYHSVMIHPFTPYSMLDHVESTVSLLKFRVTHESATKCGHFLAYIGNDEVQKKKKTLPAYAAWRLNWTFPPRIAMGVQLFSDQMTCIGDHDLMAGTVWLQTFVWPLLTT